MFNKTSTILKLNKKPGLTDHEQSGQTCLQAAIEQLEHYEYEQAYTLLKQAITDYGCAEALLYVGQMHEKGQKYPHSADIALQYYQLAKRHKVPQASRYIALLAIDGHQVSQINNGHDRFVEMAQEQGDKALGQVLLLKGMEYYRQARAEEYRQQTSDRLKEVKQDES